MKSLRYLYRIGHGPSSSHSIGPYRAAKYFKKRYPDAIAYEVTLYGSLALTGRGHLTDKTIVETLAPTSTKIVFDYKTNVPHPNTMDFTLYFENKPAITKRVFSIGGLSAWLSLYLEAFMILYEFVTFAQNVPAAGQCLWRLEGASKPEAHVCPVSSSWMS